MKKRSKTNAKQFEATYGYRYTHLLELPYYDSVKHHVIDPMHCLFLGVAKHMWKLWAVRMELFSAKDLAIINERLEMMSKATESMWLPKNIGSNWGAWTAHEWKGWTLTYSMYCLKGVLDDKYLKVWQTFVLACSNLIRPYLAKHEVDLGNLLLIKFATQVEEIHGKSCVTPNMHLMIHIKGCILDYGSVYAFWLFAFERFNFNLGNIPTNNRDMGIQRMRQVNKRNKVFAEESSLSENLDSNDPLDRFMLMSSDYRDDSVCNKYTSITASIPTGSKRICKPLWSQLDCLTLPSRKRIKQLDYDDKQLLSQCYQAMYDRDKVEMKDPIKKFDYTKVGNGTFYSINYGRGGSHSYVRAAWCGNGSVVDFTSPFRPCKIKYFFEHEVDLGNGYEKHIFAAVSWFKYYHNDQLNDCLKPIESYEEERFEQPGPASFIPVQRIYSKLAHVCVGAGRMLISEIPPQVYI